MDVSIYPDDYNPFIVFPDAPYDCTILIVDRENGSTVKIHTHKAGLEQLKTILDKAILSLGVK